MYPSEYQSLINRWQLYNTEKFEKDIYSENRKAYLNQLNRNKMAEYGIRSLEQEESLLRALYQLKTKTELLKVFTSKDLKETSFEKQIFLNYMV